VPPVGKIILTSKTFTTGVFKVILVVKVFFYKEKKLEKLYKGIHTFKASYFKKEKEFFKRLSAAQVPEVLFITCSDSRVDPNLVTQSKPGEIFIVRNVGNIVPPYDAIKDKNSVAAALEFAVLGLKVKDIIVCGHSNCGAMQTLYKDSSELSSMPHLRDWLNLASGVRDMVAKYYPNETGESKLRKTEEENVLMQLHNIQTYPFVADALINGTLHLHGWYYDIATADICSYDPADDVFKKIA
jgi:carbonic anhydrase